MLTGHQNYGRPVCWLADKDSNLVPISQHLYCMTFWGRYLPHLALRKLSEAEVKGILIKLGLQYCRNLLRQTWAYGKGSKWGCGVEHMRDEVWTLHILQWLLNCPFLNKVSITVSLRLSVGQYLTLPTYPETTTMPTVSHSLSDQSRPGYSMPPCLLICIYPSNKSSRLTNSMTFQWRLLSVQICFVTASTRRRK